MSSVFVIINETMPVNGTYPSSSLEGVYESQAHAWIGLREKSLSYFYDIHSDDTVFYVPDGSFDPEKFEYIEYRIEEHGVQS